MNVKNHLEIPNGPVMPEWESHLGIRSIGFLASQGAEKRFMGLSKLFCPAWEAMPVSEACTSGIYCSLQVPKNDAGDDTPLGQGRQADPPDCGHQT